MVKKKNSKNLKSLEFRKIYEKVLRRRIPLKFWREFENVCVKEGLTLSQELVESLALIHLHSKKSIVICDCLSVIKNILICERDSYRGMYMRGVISQLVYIEKKIYPCQQALSYWFGKTSLGRYKPDYLYNKEDFCILCVSALNYCRDKVKV